MFLNVRPLYQMPKVTVLATITKKCKLLNKIRENRVQHKNKIKINQQSFYFMHTYVVITNSTTQNTGKTVNGGLSEVVQEKRRRIKCSVLIDSLGIRSLISQNSSGIKRFLCSQLALSISRGIIERPIIRGSQGSPDGEEENQ